MFRAAALCIAFGLAHIPSIAQQAPQLAYIYPAGGQTGSTVEVRIGGQHLDNASNAYFSYADIHAVIVEHEPPLTPKDASDLRDRRKTLNQQVKTQESIKEIAAIDNKLAQFEKRRTNPALAETVPLRVTIGAQVVPGNYEVRIATPAGLSNPRMFQIGELPECAKSEDIAEAGMAATPRKERKLIGGPPPGPPKEITLPATVNGWIPPGSADRYRFHARAGQNLVIITSARVLIPYLADAVPGWFQAAVTLYDAQGRELAYDDHYRFRPDPVLFCSIPSEGEYVLEIRDALYRGREDFVYRIAVGELPFVTAVFPLGGRAGQPTPIAIQGWNLGTDHDTVQIPEAGSFSYVSRIAGRTSNRVPFALDTLPECFEHEPNDFPAKANPVIVPIIVNGCIELPGDVDVFRFEGQVGERVVAEVYARRLDSPLDSVLRLTDATGRQLAFNDDHEDKGSGLLTHHADSYFEVTLPTNGTYFVQLWDAQHKGGRAYGYRLHLRTDLPDFALRVAPSSISVRSGTSVPLTVYALRRDGFSGDIALALQDAPTGFKLSAARVLTNQDLVKLTLSAPSVPTEKPLSLHIIGRAMINGHEVIKPAVPADDMMQAFAYRHLVPSQDLEVLVTGRVNPREEAKILSATPVRIPAGGIARVQVRLATGPRIEKVEFELSDAPEGITLPESSPVKDAMEITLQSDADKVTTGQKGNLIIKIFGKRAADQEKSNPAKITRRVPLGTLPAIPFEVIRP